MRPYNNRMMKFSRASDIDEKAVAAYVKEAAALNEKGVQAASAAARSGCPRI